MNMAVINPNKMDLEEAVISLAHQEGVEETKEILRETEKSVEDMVSIDE